MRNPHAGTIRGLSIATLIISILALLGGLGFFALLSLSSMGLSDPSVAAQLETDPSTMAALESSGMDMDDALQITSIVLMLGSGIGVVVMICAIVALVAAILGMRNCDDPAKLKGAFGWSIAGAVASLLYLNLISMGLLIGLAVTIRKARSIPTFQNPTVPVS
ncbi:hypothetical protein B5F40_15165 [Gordonibacter sp. An230]|uniref:hypothetical protein n=1 Tax=Gordonibacter sp. An230 TaxID=1965592 RepID=UPI0007A81A56|nr:hypothetical protein [Gordonibacter sp. An230]OUO86313.1 hypothetical protein B5F40_15165 [Gordonibacter sp. An230]CVH78631.1 hypothetical protein BN3658_01595 [Coriobacteriaceae bacterium CHKCI002]